MSPLPARPPTLMPARSTPPQDDASSLGDRRLYRRYPTGLAAELLIGQGDAGVPDHRHLAGRCCGRAGPRQGPASEFRRLSALARDRCRLPHAGDDHAAHRTAGEPRLLCRRGGRAPAHNVPSGQPHHPGEPAGNCLSQARTRAFTHQRRRPTRREHGGRSSRRLGLLRVRTVTSRLERGHDGQATLPVPGNRCGSRTGQFLPR